MQIVPYPHPALAFKSVEIKQIDSVLRRTVKEMFELMYEANGIGLAANQVGLPFRFFIVNLQARAGNPDEELVFLNPIITRRKGSELGEEGCLSLPGLYGDVRRAEEVVIEAFDLQGQGFRMTLDDLPARVVQHETDHLDGIMFTDRMREQGTSAEIDVQIPKFVEAYRNSQKAGHLPSDDEIRQQLNEIANTGCVTEEFLNREPFEISLPQLQDR